MTASNVRNGLRITHLVALLLLAVFLILAGCATAPETQPEPEPQPEQETQPETEPSDPSTEERDDETEDVSEPEDEPEPEAEPESEPDAEPESDETQGEDDADYTVTEEVYNQTFSEVEQTIQELNQIIREQDFNEWRSYLTDAYEDEYSDPERLREISSMPILQRNDIVLESLRDYFRWVVVPSRANARLDDLRFATKTDVEAIMSVNGQRVILYHLKKVDGSWKIDTS